MSVIGEAVDLPVDTVERTELRHDDEEPLAAEIEELSLLANALSLRPIAELRSDVERVTRFVRERLVVRMESDYEQAVHLAIRDCRPVPSRATLEELEQLATRLEALAPAALAGTTDALHPLRATLFDLHTLLRLHICGAC